MMAHALATELASRTPDTLIGSCKSEDPGITCRLVWDISHSAYAAQLTRVYLAGPLNMAVKIAFGGREGVLTTGQPPVPWYRYERFR
jgi:hypothetical protein